MSVIPDEWGEPDSRAGTFYDVLWATVALVSFGTLAYFEPFSIAVVITPFRFVGLTALGVSLGFVVSYVSFTNNRYREFWATERYRFAGLFLLIVGGQVGIALIPTWTILTLFITFLTAIPIRLCVYLRTKRI